MWENNHFIITSTISDLILENGRMPTKNEISTKSKISRQTVHKHLKEYPNNPLYIEQLEVLKIMSNQIIAKVFQLAIAGDVGASKLFLNVAGSLMGNIEDSKRKIVVTIKKMEENEIKNQSNFIQINSTFLNQESVSKLNGNQILEIERILKAGIN